MRQNPLSLIAAAVSLIALVCAINARGKTAAATERAAALERQLAFAESERDYAARQARQYRDAYSALLLDYADLLDAHETLAALYEAAQSAPLIEAVPLDAATQRAIYDLCGEDARLFCLAMAMAYTESRFQANAVSDTGDIGLLQVNPRWHGERMQRLGVTDLTDPVQNTAVALDYLRELAEILGTGEATHTVLMAYNLGINGARKAWRSGAESTAYSRAVLDVYQRYLDAI